LTHVVDLLHVKEPHVPRGSNIRRSKFNIADITRPST
jgi:hypothetical protein